MSKEEVFDMKEQDQTDISILFKALPESMQEVLLKYIHLFATKNKGYSNNKHWASALLTGDTVIDGSESPCTYTMNLYCKQDKAARELMSAAFRNEGAFEARGGVTMLKERLGDGVVYRLMLLSLIFENENGMLEKSVLYDEH